MPQFLPDVPWIDRDNKLLAGKLISRMNVHPCPRDQFGMQVTDSAAASNDHIECRLCAEQTAERPDASLEYTGELARIELSEARTVLPRNYQEVPIVQRCRVRQNHEA